MSNEGRASPTGAGDGGPSGNEVPALRAESLNAWYGDHKALSAIDLGLGRHTVTGLLGPAGAGKSTLLRCINRAHELTPGARVAGRVLLFGHDIYHRSVDPAALRRDVALVASPPLPFPTMSIRDNVLAGLRFGGLLGAETDPGSWVEGCLTTVGLWHELKDRLDASPFGLSVGARLHLCIARALALRPRVVLLDRPFASLDPEASARLEQLLDALRGRHTLVLVPSTVQQAGRTCTHVALLLGGRLVEFGPTAEMLRSPQRRETEDYLTGKFGLGRVSSRVGLTPALDEALAGGWPRGEHRRSHHASSLVCACRARRDRCVRLQPLSAAPAAALGRRERPGH